MILYRSTAFVSCPGALLVWRTMELVNTPLPIGQSSTRSQEQTLLFRRSPTGAERRRRR